MGNNVSSSDQKKTWTTWFEIPVTNFNRAKLFYETIFEIEIMVNDFGNFKMGIFPHSDVGCAICQGDSYVPSENGAMVYLDANPDLTKVLNLVVPSGGQVLREKTMISAEHGHMAVIKDSEGNRLALHSNN